MGVQHKKKKKKKKTLKGLQTNIIFELIQMKTRNCGESFCYNRNF